MSVIKETVVVDRTQKIISTTLKRQKYHALKADIRFKASQRWMVSDV
jgi:hypothetical protein